ncbi:Neprilysin-1, partial [Schistosoma japonicum]
ANDPGGTHLGNIYGSSSPNPCGDFYEYACGKWITDNPLSNGIDSITTGTQAQHKIDEYIWKLVSDDSYSSNDPRLQAANKFYKSCTDYRSSKTFISACRQWIYMYFGQWGLMPPTQQIDGAPNIENMDLTDFCLPAIMQFGYSHLFSLAIDSQARSIKCKRSKENFYRMANLLRIPTFYNNAIDTAFQMMKDLCKVNDPKSSQSLKLKRNIALEELSSICPEIRWSDLFAKVFKEAQYEDYEGLPITIEGEEQLKQRCKQHALALQTDRKTYQTMVIINFVRELVKYVLQSTNTKTAIPSTSPSQPHFNNQCFIRSEGSILHTLSLQHYFIVNVKDTHKKEVTTMFEELKKTVLKSIPEYNWLTVDQKEFVSKKYHLNENNYYLNAIIIGRARNMDRIISHLSQSDVSLSPLPAFIPNAYYQRSKNRVYVNAELLQPPFYIEGDDKSSNYGRIGFTIGHELFHAIDITGVLWDEKGDIQNSEFFVTLSDLVFDQTVCFQDQYGEDESTRHKTHRRLSAKLAGLVRQDPDTTRKRDQSYFRNFAQFFCGNERGKALENYIESTPYVVRRERVNLALSNSEEFAKAYHCPIGSPMNPPEKCRVY